MQLGSCILWLWHRLAAVALIRLLEWGPPGAAGMALKKVKKKGGVTSQIELWPNIKTSLTLITSLKNLSLNMVTF